MYNINMINDNLKSVSIDQKWSQRPKMRVDNTYK